MNGSETNLPHRLYIDSKMIYFFMFKKLNYTLSKVGVKLNYSKYYIESNANIVNLCLLVWIIGWTWKKINITEMQLNNERSAFNSRYIFDVIIY